ncbi:hypothetical protein BC943DRAFT_319115 [Umbelopsis sp. AD052]|nr:hypothetical protein BC943DRAFT_319115 [Umbelopsis sp. AD052]
MVKYQHIISKKGDILFSIAVGAGAYFMYERDNPRPEGKGLLELINRRRINLIQEREALRQERLEKLQQREDKA